MIIQHRATWAALVLLSASAVLVPTGPAPLVSAPAELWALAVAGAVALVVGVRSWQEAPLQVAAFASPDARRSPWPQLLMASLALAGLLSALIGVLQVCWPQALQGPWDGWVQPSHDPSRAVGHMRQPNHLATLLVWGALAWAVLHAQAHLPRGAGSGGMALLMVGVVLSGSRTGLLGVALLPLWALLDHRLPRHTRHLLLAAPLMAAAAFAALHLWAAQGGEALGVVTRINPAQAADVSSGRWAIWSNAMELIAQQPWSGVGVGHFNIAWTLTPLSGRPGEPFGHAHNLPLQLLTVLGLPLGLAVMAAASVVLYQATVRAWSAQQPQNEGLARRGAWMILLAVGWHSLLEYPLWYAYFSLPAALAVLVCGGWDRPLHKAARWQALFLMLAGGAMLVLSAWAFADLRTIRAVYSPAAGAGPLPERIERGEHSTWFSDQAHYARAVTLQPEPGQPWADASDHTFERASHVLLDPRLLMAWADALAARNGPGDRDRARYLAARLRELQHPAAQPWLQACSDGHTPLWRHFVCEAPEHAWVWRDFYTRP
jgi:O-antigen ligase